MTAEIKSLIDAVHPSLFNKIIALKNTPKPTFSFRGSATEEDEMQIQPIIVLDNISPGSIIADLSITNNIYAAPYVFSFTSNPGNFFTISGSDLILAFNPPLGTITIGLHASNGIASVSNSISIEVVSQAPVWIPGQRPFTPTSPANLRLPTGSVLTQVPWDAATGFNYYCVPKWQFDIPDASTTTIVSWLQHESWGNPIQTYNRIMTPGFTGRALDPDAECISFAGSNCLSLYQFNRTSDTTATSNGAASCDILASDGFGVGVLSSGGHGTGVVAAGCSVMVGALVKEEFTANATIDHVIGLSLLTTYCNNGTPNFYSPSINGDGNSGNGFIMNGQLMAIPSSTSMPGGLSQYGTKIFTAMKNYGAFVYDTGGISGFNCASSYNTPSTSWQNADIGDLISDANILVPLLYKVGFPEDGLLFIDGIFDSYGPQLQLQRYGGPLIQVTRDSDSTTLDIAQVGPPTGMINTTSISTFCSGTTGRVSKYYAQKNGSHFTSAGVSAPIIYQSGIINSVNNVPIMLFDGTSNWMSSTLTTQSYVNAVVQVADRTGNYAVFGSNASGGVEFRINATTGFPQLMANTGTVIATSSTAVALNTPTTLEASYNTTTGAYRIWQNRTLTATGTNLVTTVAGNLLLGAGNTSSTDLFKGMLSPGYVGGGPPTRPQYVLTHYEKNLWGTP